MNKTKIYYDSIFSFIFWFLTGLTKTKEGKIYKNNNKDFLETDKVSTSLIKIPKFIVFILRYSLLLFLSSVFLIIPNSLIIAFYYIAVPLLVMIVFFQFINKNYLFAVLNLPIIISSFIFAYFFIKQDFTFLAILFFNSLHNFLVVFLILILIRDFTFIKNRQYFFILNRDYKLIIGVKKNETK